MKMNKEIFDELMTIEGISFYPLPTIAIAPYSECIGGTNYIIEGLKNNKDGIVFLSVHEYPNGFTLTVKYSESWKNVMLQQEKEDDIYELAYRFIYVA